LENSLDLSVSDNIAFGIKISDDSLEPCLPQCSFAIASPHAPFKNGQIHFVQLKNGECHIARMVVIEGDYVALEALSNSYNSLYVRSGEIIVAWRIIQILFAESMPFIETLSAQEKHQASGNEN